MERRAYMLYNTAITAAATICRSFSGKSAPDPWQCFPGWIKHEIEEMSEDELLAVCMAWCGLADTGES